MDPGIIQVLIWFVLPALLGMVTAKIASDRGLAGHPVSWWIAGTFLFIVAIPLAIFMKPDPKVLEKQGLKSGVLKKCPQCAELIKKEALKCRFCGHEFEALKNRTVGLMPCPSCKRDIPRASTFCPFCRASI